MSTREAVALYKRLTGRDIGQDTLRRYIREGRIAHESIMGRYAVDEASMRKFAKAHAKTV